MRGIIPKEVRRTIALSAVGEVIDRVRMQVVANIGPKPRQPTAAFCLRIKHPHRRVVGPDHARLKHALDHPLIKRL